MVFFGSAEECFWFGWDPKPDAPPRDAVVLPALGVEPPLDVEHEHLDRGRGRVLGQRAAVLDRPEEQRGGVAVGRRAVGARGARAALGLERGVRADRVGELGARDARQDVEVIRVVCFVLFLTASTIFIYKYLVISKLTIGYFL